MQEFNLLQPRSSREKELRQSGYQKIAGVDEAGRGPLAGPVVAAACILEDNFGIEGLADSKKLTEEERERLFQEIVQSPNVCYAIGVIDAFIIDQINILQATFKAMWLAITALQKGPDFILVDGSLLPPALPCLGEAVIKGDGIEPSIMAASIVAKVTRDRMMREYHEKWPQYGFAIHKGYGTAQHRKAIDVFGPCEIHRLTFAPLKNTYVPKGG